LFPSSSSTSNGTKLTVSGVVILITLTTKSNDGEEFLASSFALSFLQKNINHLVLIPDRYVATTTFVTGEERTASYREDAWDMYRFTKYFENTDHLMVIARESGKNFYLTQTFLDIKCKDFIREFVVEDVAEEKTQFRVGPA